MTIFLNFQGVFRVQEELNYFREEDIIESYGGRPWFMVCLSKLSYKLTVNRISDFGDWLGHFSYYRLIRAVSRVTLLLSREKRRMRAKNARTNAAEIQTFNFRTRERFLSRGFALFPGLFLKKQTGILPVYGNYKENITVISKTLSFV